MHIVRIVPDQRILKEKENMISANVYEIEKALNITIDFIVGSQTIEGRPCWYDVVSESKRELTRCIKESDLINYLNDLAAKSGQVINWSK